MARVDIFHGLRVGNGLNACYLCGAKCCKDRIITVTSFDVLRVSKLYKLNPAEFCELRRLDLIFYDEREVIKAFEDGYENYYLLTFKSHPCYFLKNDLCSIFKNAPLVCRIYPYGESGIGKVVVCPSFNKLLHFFKKPKRKLFERYKLEKALYHKIVEVVNKKLVDRDKVLDVILKETTMILKKNGLSLEV